MGTRDALPGEPESVGAIWASDHFIEQLQANGTYEPASRTDARLAGALVAWRDEVREEPISAPPRAEDVEIDPRPIIQPRRIARRAVAVAGVLLAMSSAMATALDADPLKPVRYLVDLGVTVGERISDPVNDPSAEEAPSPSIGEGYVEGQPDSGGLLQLPDDEGLATNPAPKQSLPAESPATDEEAAELQPTPEPTDQPTAEDDPTDVGTAPPTEDSSEEPTDSGESEESPTSDSTTEPTTDSPPDPSTDPSGVTPPPAEGEGEGDHGGTSGGDDNSAGDNGNPQDQQAAPPAVQDPGMYDAGDFAGIPDSKGGTFDEGIGDDTYGDHEAGDSSLTHDGDGAYDDGRDPEVGDPLSPSALPNFGPLFDADQWPGLIRHGYATHGQGLGHHDGTIRVPAKAHPHRGDAWKSQVLLYLTRLHRSD